MRGLLASIVLVGCAEPASLDGVWTGSLSCSSELVGDFALDMSLELVPAEAERAYDGELVTFAAYAVENDTTGELDAMTITRSYLVGAEHKYRTGPQDVLLTELCDGVEVTVNGAVEDSLSSCAAVEDEGGTETVGWDGVDALSFHHRECTGDLVR